MRIIAFGNSRYKRIAHNWALYLQQHGITNYTIYSLDQETYDYLVENNINTELLNIAMFKSDFTHANHGSSWDLRFNATRRLLESEDVLHSDLDAIWLRDPLGFIDNSYDIVSSTGRFPHKNALCMGWIYFRSCNAVKKVFDNILDNQKDFDDQQQFNFEVAKHDLNIRMLGQDIVSRRKTHNDNTYVAHPSSDKNIDREKFLKRKNLWRLK